MSNKCRKKINLSPLPFTPSLNDNTAAQGGGSLYLLGDSAALSYSVTNTILANTTADNSVADALINTINGGTTAQGAPANTHNLVEVNGAGVNALPGVTQTGDPNLGALTDTNGGPTATHALLSGSPAIETGDNAAVGALTTRGPGFDRISGCVVDIGAFDVLQQACNQAPEAVDERAGPDRQPHPRPRLRVCDRHALGSHERHARPAGGSGRACTSAPFFGGVIPSCLIRHAPCRKKRAKNRVHNRHTGSGKTLCQDPKVIGVERGCGEERVAIVVRGL